ncbi:asparagine synthase (glutamine-hydrolyzing) [soil metagenome]
MCGIAGIVERRASGALGQNLATMASAMAHRGPDGFGYAAVNGRNIELTDAQAIPRDTRIGLAHRRLSIIDLSSAATQPMIDEAKTRAITYNGEVYNHAELRQSYFGGRQWVSAGDTEVLFRAFAERGIEALADCVGMFAFAYVDLERKVLTLIRDPFGIKPLYYIAEPDRFAFASEICPLTALLQKPLAADPVVVHRFLRYAVTDADERTFFRAVKQVRPGGGLEISLDDPARVREFTWWTPVSKSSRTPRARADAAAELRALFIDSVKLHLRADTPVATTLSGGIDSSAIVSAARKVLGPDAVIHSFTYRAGDDPIDEGQYAKVAARAAQVVSHDIHGSPDALAGELDALILTQEQPFTTTSMYAQALVFRAVAEKGFKVAVDGQGSDEIFAGYHAFAAARLATDVREARFAEAGRLLMASSSGRMRLLGATAERLMPGAMSSILRSALARSAFPSWLSGEWFAQTDDSLDNVHPGYGTSLKDELFNATWRASLPMLLRYADRNAMAVSVENRVPFLTPDIARFAFSLPSDFLIDGNGVTKSLLREALRGLVPDELLDRRDKIGFQTPEAGWLQASDLLRAKLKNFFAGSLPPFLSPDFRNYAVSVIDGHKPYDPAVWRVANLIRWAQLSGVTF